jgi:predicted membrane chloride channel (bestrophin family)
MATTAARERVAYTNVCIFAVLPSGATHVDAAVYFYCFSLCQNFLTDVPNITPRVNVFIILRMFLYV